MTPQTKQHKRTIACVVDTETCFKNSTAHGLVYHFGAVFGNIEQTESHHVKKMDYYVKEVMEDIQNFLFKNKETGKHTLRMGQWLEHGKTLLIIHTRLNHGKI